MSAFLREEAAAKYLNFSVSTLQKWRFRGLGPNFVKIGVSVRYRLTDLETFTSERIQTPAREVAAAPAEAADGGQAAGDAKKQ